MRSQVSIAVALLAVIAVGLLLYSLISSLNTKIDYINSRIDYVDRKLGDAEILNIYQQLFASMYPFLASSIHQLVNLSDYIPFVINQPVYLNDSLALHLYDWFFNYTTGNSYILTSAVNSSTVHTIMVSVNTQYIGPQPPYADWIFYLSGSGTWFGFISGTLEPNGFTIYRICNPSNSEISLSVNVYELNKNIEALYRHTGSQIEIYKNGLLVGSRTDTTGVKQGSGQFFIGSQVNNPGTPFYMQYFIYYRTLVNTTAQSLKILTPQNLTVFLDPTFFNSSHYIDLSGFNNHGTPFNNVRRVRANTTWVWFIRGHNNDNMIHLRFIPRNSIIIFANGDWLRINATANPVGLVEDFPINRTDIVLILVPRSGW